MCLTKQLRGDEVSSKTGLQIGTDVSKIIKLKELGENRARVDTCILGEGAQCRIVAEEQDSENWEYRSAG